MAIRLTKSDKDKIRKINQSIARKNKQMENYNIDIYKPIIKASDFTSRKQLNNYLDEARTYTRGYAYKYKQNTYCTVVSNIELARAKRLAQEVSRDRAKRFKEIAPQDFTSRGKSTGSSVIQRKLMGDSRYDMYDPVKINFSSLRNRKQFENRIKHFQEQLTTEYMNRKNQQLKDNLIQAMVENWGSDGKKAIDYVKGLTPDEVVKEYMKEDIFDFNYIYDESKRGRRIEIFEATYNIT